MQGVQLMKPTIVILETIEFTKTFKGETILYCFIFLLYLKYISELFLNGHHFPIWQPNLNILIVNPV